MGMSASQARLLSLQARQSNLEYQGQQINQARTVLSQQATALYNSLLSMTVPTPPSTTDFQTIEYSGVMGATEFTLGTITPEASGDTEINAKTEIIQQEDRNLELKLQRLDNERTQISTEIEAVEKVINDNIEASYKTFSG